VWGHRRRLSLGSVAPQAQALSTYLARSRRLQKPATQAGALATGSSRRRDGNFLHDVDPVEAPVLHSGA
jgi:hypothetical protein